MKKILKINRFNILIFITSILLFILFINLFHIQIVRYNFYREKYNAINTNILEGETAPRGRIYDRNYKLLVDNEPVKVIYYKKNGLSTKEEIALAYKVANIIDVDYSKITDSIKRNFWIKKYSEKAKNKISEKEYIDLSYRKLTGKDIENLKLKRVTEDELNSFNELDLEAAYIYYLMNKGFSYSEKVIKNKDVTDLEYAKVASMKEELKGFSIKLDWNRSYLYNDTFKSIFGTVSTSEVGIPEDLMSYYLKKGYSRDDRVGTSYLEYQYDDYLKGKKNEYRLNKDGSLNLVNEGSKGNDIVLTIDIDLQMEVDKIIEEELIKAKQEPNTDYYNRSFVIITNPKTGEILAMSGKQIVFKDNDIAILDYTPGIFTSSVVVGSVIKGASHIVGYNNNALKIGEVRYDNCVKLKSAPTKCSWKYLGKLDDLTALKQSSNTYQFYTAFNVAGVNYSYNMPFKLENDAFKIYRKTFNEFGLGVKTGIDLPNESEGLKGKNESGGLLLDFVIGQYDNYTPLQLSQYISTIANNGSRLKPYLLKEVYEASSNLTNRIYKTEPKELNKVNTEDIYMKRVQEGLKKVLEYGGTGSGYIDRTYNPAGKTGTSQSFVDTDLDGIVDTETVSNTFVGYAPSDDPVVTFTVVSPDIYNYGSEYQSYVNKRITKRISEKYFEIYK